MAEAVELGVELAPSIATTDDLRRRYLEQYASSVRLAFLLTGDRSAAEDLVQEAFVRIFSRPRKVQNAAAFPTYVRRTITNLAFSRARSTTRERQRAERAHRLGAAPPDTVADDLDAGSRDLLHALDVLPERQRAAIVLRFWLDLSEREMAGVLNCRPGTVKSLLSRALDTLRNELDR